MHSDTRILVTQFCNPETLSNAHGLLGCILQCNSGKNNKIKHVESKLSRFLFGANSLSASSDNFGEALPISSIQIGANPTIKIDFQAHLTRQSHSTDVLSKEGVLSLSHVGQSVRQRRASHFPTIKSTIQDKHLNSNKRFSLRKNSIL